MNENNNNFIFWYNFAYRNEITGAMKDNMRGLRMGFLHLLPTPDEAGRAIIYYDT